MNSITFGYTKGWPTIYWLHCSLGQHTEQQVQNNGYSWPGWSAQSAQTSTDFSFTMSQTPSVTSPTNLLDSSPMPAEHMKEGR
jgi:hypothetical protein